jgi:sigma-B regulation protein RsbU (phosphoserine phosphatase)
MCCAILDSDTLSVALATAGHPAPFLYRPAEHRILKLESSGPPVGLDRDAIFEQCQVDWKPGDALFFYTDGVTEALLGKGPVGGLEEIVLKLEPGLSVPEIARALRSELETIKEAGGLEDDVTLLTVALEPRS